jgi:hypothetical protein
LTNGAQEETQAYNETTRGIAQMMWEQKPDKSKTTFRRMWEFVGHIHVITWLFEISHGSFVISSIAAAGVAYWTWATEHGYLPVFFAALGTFVAVVWAINGIVWLRSQARPSKARITFDYSYGLSLEEVTPALDVDNVNNTLEIRLYVRNLANGPMKITTEQFDTTIEDRFHMMPTKIEAVLPRAAAITLFPGGGFRKEAFDKFADRTTGTLEFSILYGHPEDQLSRRTTKTLRLGIFKLRNDKGELLSAAINRLVQKESDMAI